jgi:sulfur-oxidizing protein SoxY
MQPNWPYGFWKVPNEIKRRDSLKQIAILSGLLAGVGYSSLAEAAYNKAAFDSKSVNEAIKLQGGGNLIESKEVLLIAPDYAENGAAVPLGVSTGLSGVRKILILVEKNPASLAASFEVSESIEANFSTRIKMNQTSDVFAVAVMADGRALFSKKEVKVTIGSCGG